MLSTTTSLLVSGDGRRLESVRLSPPRRLPSPETPSATSDDSSESPLPTYNVSVVQKVLLPQGKAFTPRREKPIVHSYLAQQQNAKNPKPDHRHGRVILHRFQTENGGAVFALGTRRDGTVTRDAEDVPSIDILKYVTIEELSRFEDESYAEDAEKERIRILNMKPRGRPRKNVDGTAPAAQPKPAAMLKPGGYAAARDPNEPRKRGRPLGWRKNAVFSPPKASMPSFNGPRPTGENASDEASNREQSEELTPSAHESPVDVQNRTGVYSMVAASKLVSIPDESDPVPPTPIVTGDEMEIDDSEAETPSEQSAVASQLDSTSSQNSSPLPETVSLINSSSKDETTPKTAYTKQPSERNNDHENERAKLVRAFNQPQNPWRRTENEAANLLKMFSARPTTASSRPAPPPSATKIAASTSSQLQAVQPPPTPTSSLPRTMTPFTSSSAARSQTPARRPPKRKSLTPHFPGGSGKIPRRTDHPGSSRRPHAEPVTAREVLIPVKPVPARKGSRTKGLSFVGAQSRISPFFKKSAQQLRPASAVKANEVKVSSGKMVDVVSISSGSDDTDDSDGDEEVEEDKRRQRQFHARKEDNDDRYANDDESMDEDGDEEEEEVDSADAFVGVETTNIDPRLARTTEYPDSEEERAASEGSRESEDEV